MSLGDKNQKTVTVAWVEMKREAFRKGLFWPYEPFYERLCDALDGTFWAPTDGWRSMEKQQHLYDQGRKNPGKIITQARPGFSPHNWGCATDWAEYRPEFVGTDIWNKADWKVFGEAVRKVGLRWGGDFHTFPDRPHCELNLRVSWKEVGLHYEANGQLLTADYIVQNLI